MATISIDIPAGQTARVVSALCAAGGLPESPANAKQVVINWIKATVRNVETAAAQEAAAVAVKVTDVTPA